MKYRVQITQEIHWQVYVEDAENDEQACEYALEDFRAAGLMDRKMRNFDYDILPREGEVTDLERCNEIAALHKAAMAKGRKP